jgi:hypothetical protein
MRKQTTAYGLPVVTAGTVFSTLAQRGIGPWKELRCEPLLDWLGSPSRTKAELLDFARFGPKAEVVYCLKPPAGPLTEAEREFIGFRERARPWITTLVLLPNPDDQSDPFVVIVGEFKHGAWVVSIAPPSGVPNAGDRLRRNPWIACAKRVFKSETGLRLSHVRLLTAGPTPLSGRQSDQGYLPAIGLVREPIPVSPQADPVEGRYLRTLLIPWRQWLLFQTRCTEVCSRDVTWLATLTTDIAPEPFRRHDLLALRHPRRDSD